MISAVLLIFCSLVNVQAQPRDVTVTPVNLCSALPKYNSATDIAGPWTVKVDGCSSATASREACRIEGFGASCDLKRSPEEKGIEKGSITIANSLNHGQTPLRCNGALQTLEALVPSGAGALDWHAIGIDRDSNSGEMQWGLGSKHTEPVQVYRQHVHGSPVDGVFLGSKGHTNWAVHHSGPGLSSVDRRPLWFLRLLSKDTTLWSDEYKASIRIDGS